MSEQDRQKQTEKFVGCILSLKTKPGKFGDVQHIIGTVREIDVGSSEQAIILDQAMCNGQMLPDGYVLQSCRIADLQVMGKANEIQANLMSAYSQSEARRSVVLDDSRNESGSAREPKNSNSSIANGSESLQNVNGNHVHSTAIQSLKNNSSATLMNSITSAVVGMTVREKAANVDESESSNHMIAKPKPRKVVDGPSYVSSPQENKGAQSRSQQQSSVTNKVSFPTTPNETNCKSSTNIGLSSNDASGDGGNILLRTFGNFSTSANNGQALFSSNKTVATVANLKQNNVASPSKASPQKPIMYDHKKLGVLSQFVSSTEPSTNQAVNNEVIPQLQHAPGTPTAKIINNTQTPRSQTKHTGRQRHGETFESMSKDEMAVEFDFEGSNAQFEKLPVNCLKPQKVTKNPQFSNTDTTYLADRVVESVTLRETVTSAKQFVTDTGVLIPSIDLSTRSKILNLAHEAGLTHSRVVEIMGRAVAQACIPLFGDSYRLSPERVEDRPWVLVCAGPHWQGAIGTAAARILASLGVHTCVLAPKEEIQLCAAEEVLYGLSGGMFSRLHSDFKGIRFDLVIMAMDDHLSEGLTLAPFSRWLKNCPVVFVDPPLISSYRQRLDAVCGGDKGRKIVIVSPVLPIAYPADFSVKIFLVNLGIPYDIFQRNDVNYKSPFGDKLVIQIFSSSSK